MIKDFHFLCFRVKQNMLKYLWKKKLHRVRCSLLWTLQTFIAMEIMKLFLEYTIAFSGICHYETQRKALYFVSEWIMAGQVIWKSKDKV